MANIRGFRELEDKIRELAVRFDTQRQPQRPRDEEGQFRPEEGYFDPKERIGAGIQSALGPIRKDAHGNVSEKLGPGEASTVHTQSNDWNHHYLYSTSDLVKYHEFGTSTKAQDPSQATIESFPNGKRGYRIPAPPDQYFAIPESEWSGPEWMVYRDGDEKNAVIFDYVVHPGVESQRFLQRALEYNTHLIRNEVADELDNIDIQI